MNNRKKLRAHQLIHRAMHPALEAARASPPKPGELALLGEIDTKVADDVAPSSISLRGYQPDENEKKSTT